MPYFEVGVFHPKTKENIGTLWRTAYQLNAAGIFVIGQRYRGQPGDTCKAARHIPLRQYQDFDQFLAARPDGAKLIAVEMGGISLTQFAHPRQAIYLLGSEDYGLPLEIIEQCDCLVSLEAVNNRLLSYNVAVAGSIVLYNRVFSELQSSNSFALRETV